MTQWPLHTVEELPPPRAERVFKGVCAPVALRGTGAGQPEGVGHRRHHQRPHGTAGPGGEHWIEDGHADSLRIRGMIELKGELIRHSATLVADIFPWCHCMHCICKRTSFNSSNTNIYLIADIKFTGVTYFWWFSIDFTFEKRMDLNITRCTTSSWLQLQKQFLAYKANLLFISKFLVWS